MSELKSIPCASAILYNKGHQVLLQQRDNKPDLPFAGCWTLFGGQIEINETPDNAIKRELVEEINLKPNLTHWKTYNRQHNEHIIIIQHIFIAPINQKEENITLNEGQSMGFFNYKQLDSLSIGFGFKELLDEFFNSWEFPVD